MNKKAPPLKRFNPYDLSSLGGMSGSKKQSFQELLKNPYDLNNSGADK